jgi:hypothetical protein
MINNTKNHISIFGNKIIKDYYKFTIKINKMQKCMRIGIIDKLLRNK